MAILEDIENAIAEGFGIEDTSNISYRPPVEERSTAADPEQASQPQLPTSYDPEEDPVYEAVSYAVPDFGPVDFDIGGDDDFVYASPSEQELNTRREEALDRVAVQQSQQGTLAAPSDDDSAADEYMNMLMDMENAQKKGRRMGPNGRPLFFPFESVEGTGPDAKVFSNMEVGYGNKVMKDWLEDDKSKWPVVDGVPVNVREGLTDRQARSLMEKSLASAGRAASKRVPGYEEMTAWEKQYWNDLTYNSGHDVSRKNPKAIKAAKAGYSAESLIRTFDFISAGGNKMRGLLNRRLNMFNLASSETSGLPAVEEYSWGPEGIKVKFAAPITTDKVSKRFRDRINNNDGWYTVAKGSGDKQETFRVDESFQFK